MDSGTLVVPPDYLWTLWGGIAPRGSFYVGICHGDGFSYEDKSQPAAFSFSILDTRLKRVIAESLTVLLRRCGWYVRYGKWLHVASIRRFFLHGDVLRALISRPVYLSIPMDNTQNFVLYNFVDSVRRFARHFFLIRKAISYTNAVTLQASCKWRFAKNYRIVKKKGISFLSNLPETTVRTDLEEIAVLTVRDWYRGRLILGLIIAIVAVSRAITRFLLHVRT